MDYYFNVTTYNKKPLLGHIFKEEQSILINTSLRLSEDILNKQAVILTLELYSSFHNILLKSLELTDDTLPQNNVRNFTWNKLDTSIVILPDTLKTYFSDLNMEITDKPHDIKYKILSNLTIFDQQHILMEEGMFTINS